MKRIPVPVGLFLVICLISIVGVGLELATRTKARASKATEPQHITIVNITESSFSIAWKTTDPTTGIIFITDSQGIRKSAFDLRDNGSSLTPRTTHFVTASMLREKSNYSVTIVSSGHHYPLQSGPVITAPNIIDEPTPLQPAFGTVMTPNGTPAKDEIILLTIDGSQQLGAILKASGSWVIPLSTIRVETLNKRMRIDTPKRITISVLGSPDTQIHTTTDAMAPVADFLIGQTKDFTGIQSNSVKSADITTAPTRIPGSVLGTQDDTFLTTSQSKDTPLIILQPKDKSSLAYPKPMIRGMSVAKKPVTITISGETIESGATQSDAQGVFVYTPKKVLSPGKHTVTVTSKDAKGKPIAVTHSFLIFKSGTQVLGDATPSGELTTPTPTEVIIPTIILTPTETIYPMGIPTETEATTPTALPSNIQDPPVTGNTTPWFLLLLTAGALFTAGILFTL